MNSPVPNHIIITEADYFCNGEFIDRFYTVHIPIVDGELAKDIGVKINNKFASAVDYEFSDDDGGHLCVYYDIDSDKYRNVGTSIAKSVRNMRDQNTDNGHIYRSSMSELQDYVVSEIEDSENNDNSEENENLRYIH